MKIKTTPLATLVFILVALGFSQTPPIPVAAQPGDIASGVVESEKEGKLYLNTTPCKPAQEGNSVIPRQPRAKSSALGTTSIK